MFLKKGFCVVAFVLFASTYGVDQVTHFTWPNYTVPGSIALDGIYGVYVYRNSVGSKLALFRSYTTNAGYVWSGAEQISDPAQDVSDGYHVILQKKYAIAAWAISSGSDQLIQSSYSEDSGQTWATFQTISTSGGVAEYPELSISGENAIIAWKKPEGGNTRVQVSYSNNHGRSWSSPKNISLLGFDASAPSLALDGNSGMIVWVRNDVVQVTCSNDGGQTWNAPFDLSSSQASQPRIALLGGGAIAIWHRNVAGQEVIEMRTSFDGGAHWSDVMTDNGGTLARRFFRVEQWTDNQWAYYLRLMDLLQYVARKKI